MLRTLGRARPALFAILASSLMACGAGVGPGQSSPRGSSDRIIESELDPLHQFSALEAIQRLRPRWLTTRTGTPPMVHVDGNIQMGGVEALRTLRASDIQELRRLSAADATTRFGTNYVGGAILVTTKR